MVLEPLKRRPVEFGVTDDVAGRIDQRHSVTGCDACFVGQRVRIHPRPPLSRKQTCLSREIVSGLISDAGVKLVVDDDDNRDHQYRYDRERLKKQPVREPHERSLTFRIR